MKKILLIILLVFVASSAALAAFKHDTISARLIQYSDFEEIQTDIYVSPQVTAKQKRELITLIENAKSRITSTFGAYTAAPVIISYQDPKIRKKYSDNSFAKALLLPFSQSKAYIVIGENGHNIDVVAHELMHAEVFKRIGYMNQMMEIPIWFNEGISMQVDFRDKYNDSSANKPLEKLKYGWQFFRGNSEEVTQHYSLAKKEVKEWLHGKDINSLYDFLEGINKGNDFWSHYKKPINN